MTVQLKVERINFHFDPTLPINTELRANKGAIKAFFPEWQNVDNFVIAYVPSKGRSPQLKVAFSSTGLKESYVEIKGTALDGNALGDTAALPVEFDGAGNTAEIAFPLPQSQLPYGVQSYTVSWDWQFRTNKNQAWTPFQTTSHRVYCTIGPPTAPWIAEQPWPAVLEQACRWAQGAQTEAEAATKITHAVFDLGTNGIVTYDYGPKYAHDKFDCKGFLTLLSNGVGVAPTLNCDDCATIVSTFANILGCDLNQSAMGYNFDTNYYRLIGAGYWQTNTIYRHAVAWKGQCGSQDPLYDACLQIDADKDPANLMAKGHLPHLPTNQIFGSGSAKENDYKFCLVKATSSQLCEPKPGELIRRPIDKSYLGARKFKAGEYLELLKAHYEFDSWSTDAGLNVAASKFSVNDLIRVHSAFDGWEFVETNTYRDEDFTSVDQITLLMPGRDPASMVEVNLYVSADETLTNGLLLQLLAQFELPGIHRIDSALASTTAFAGSDETLHIVKSHQLIGLVRSVGIKPVRTTRMAKAIEDYIIGFRSEGERSFAEVGISAMAKAKNEFTKGVADMAHKLAEQWHCHKLGGDGLDKDGIMDLRSMDVNGRLTSGNPGYHVPAGFRLEGEAVGGHPVYQLTLREYDLVTGRLHATYDGVLAHEDANGKMVIAGKVHYEPNIEPGGEQVVEPEALRDQYDPPWVITKP